MSTVTDRIGNLEIRDNAVAANAERLPYEVYDLAHPNHNYPILVATFGNRVDAIQYAQIITGEGNDEELASDHLDERYDHITPEDYGDSMDGDFDSGMASAGFGTDEDYHCYMEVEGGY